MKKPIRHNIPRKSVYRLSVYLRCLNRLKSNSLQTICSEALAQAAGVKSARLRKDLTHLSHIGTRGRGYDVDQLAALINETLGTNSLQPVVLIGVGSRCGAASLSRIWRRGFRIVATTVPGRAGLALSLVWGRKSRYFRFKAEDPGAPTKGRVSSPACLLGGVEQTLQAYMSPCDHEQQLLE